MKIIEILKKKPSDTRYISKHTRIPESVVSGLIKELVEDEIVSKSEDVLSLTEKGEEVYSQIKGMR
jgi:predicted transcriptional regulator